MPNELLRPRWLFNASVWTENAIDLATGLGLDPFRIMQRKPDWGDSVPHLILSPSARTFDFSRFLKSDRPIVIGPSTDWDELGIPDFHHYCTKTLRSGLDHLGNELATLNPQSLPLGIIADMPEDPDEVISSTRKAFGALSWRAYRVSGTRFYFGPALEELAANYLIAQGVYPRHSVLVLNEPGDVENGNAELDRILYGRLSLGNALAKKAGRADFDPSVLAIPAPGQAHLQNLEGTEDDLATWEIKRKHFVEIPKEELSKIDQLICFAQSTNLHYHSVQVRNEKQLTRELRKHQDLAAQNKSQGLLEFQSLLQDRLPWSRELCNNLSTELDSMARDGDLFDHRCGAIAFSPYEWADLASILDGEWKDIFEFFNDRSDIPWQRDRPNYQRILNSPTKVLLRGETYYLGMMNISPLLRFKQLKENLEKTIALLTPGLATFDTKAKWKLLLGLLDQLRNDALQVSWLENSLQSEERFSGLGDPDFKRAASSFLSNVVMGYYSVLCGLRQELDMTIILADCKCIVGFLNSFYERLNKRLGDWQSDLYEFHFETPHLIRGWREADHPGENLLVALLADKRFGETNPVPIGIGWGGIELPLVYQVVRKLKSKKDPPPVFCAHYSLYSRSGRKEDPLLRALDESRPEEIFKHPDTPVLIFDDNSLTGRTLKKVLEFMRLKWGCLPVGVFLTRISGERRYGQMRMKDHGTLPPSLVGSFIFGHLGETPFSRALSRDDYKNPIKVFSLSRRRVPAWVVH